MKNIFKVLFLAVPLLFFASCSDDDDGEKAKEKMSFFTVTYDDKSTTYYEQSDTKNKDNGDYISMKMEGVSSTNHGQYIRGELELNVTKHGDAKYSLMTPRDFILLGKDEPKASIKVSVRERANLNNVVDYESSPLGNASVGVKIGENGKYLVNSSGSITLYRLVPATSEDDEMPASVEVDLFNIGEKD